MPGMVLRGAGVGFVVLLAAEIGFFGIDPTLDTKTMIIKNCEYRQ